jgi:hypothetical protein
VVTGGALNRLQPRSTARRAATCGVLPPAFAAEADLVGLVLAPPGSAITATTAGTERSTEVLVAAGAGISRGRGG